eukprot:4458436-Pleurochrysis_carterae.AAC.3
MAARGKSSTTARAESALARRPAWRWRVLRPGPPPSRRGCRAEAAQCSVGLQHPRGERAPYTRTSRHPHCRAEVA